MKALALAVVASSAIAVLGVNAQGRQGRGGPPPVYRVDVPESKFDVIAGAPTASSVILSIRGNAGSSLVLDVKDASGLKVSTPKISLDSSLPKEFTVTGLKPATTYTYRLEQGEEHVEGRFVTARPAGSPFTFAIQADSHLDGNSGLEMYRRTLGNIVQDRPDFLVDLGDTFMVDKYPNFKDSLKQYEAQRYWFSLLGSQMSVFLCLGNHDGETGWSGKGGEGVTAWARQQRQTYFPVIRENGFYTGAPKKGLYYAWAWGDATFIVLDPFVATTRKSRNDEDGWIWTLGKDQFDWFEKTLKGSKSKYKFVFIHHLVGGFGGSEARGGIEAADRFEWGGKDEFPSRREGWAEPIHHLMKRYGVTAMFHGHDHLYVRQEKDGIVYLEVPQPSHARGDSTGSAADYGYKTGKLLGSSGHIRVTVGPEAVKLEYVKSQSGEGNRKVVDSIELKGKP